MLCATVKPQNLCLLNCSSSRITTNEILGFRNELDQTRRKLFFKWHGATQRKGGPNVAYVLVRTSGVRKGDTRVLPPLSPNGCTLIHNTVRRDHPECWKQIRLRPNFWTPLHVRPNLERRPEIRPIKWKQLKVVVIADCIFVYVVSNFSEPVFQGHPGLDWVQHPRDLILEPFGIARREIFFTADSVQPVQPAVSRHYRHSSCPTRCC